MDMDAIKVYTTEDGNNDLEEDIKSGVIDRVYEDMAECKPMLTPKMDTERSQEMEEASYKAKENMVEKVTVVDTDWNEIDAVHKKHVYDNGAEGRHLPDEGEAWAAAWRKRKIRTKATALCKPLISPKVGIKWIQEPEEASHETKESIIEKKSGVCLPLAQSVTEEPGLSLMEEEEIDKFAGLNLVEKDERFQPNVIDVADGKDSVDDMLNKFLVEEISLLEEEIVPKSCTAAMAEILAHPEVSTWESMLMFEVENPSYTAMERNVVGDVEQLMASRKIMECEVLKKHTKKLEPFRVSNVVPGQNQIGDYDDVLLTSYKEFSIKEINVQKMFNCNDQNVIQEKSRMLLSGEYQGKSKECKSSSLTWFSLLYMWCLMMLYVMLYDRC